MANPAEALHEILDKWMNPANVSIMEHRKIWNRGPESAMRKHRIAVGLINEIEQVLNGTVRSESRRAYHDETLAEITRMVFAYPHHWQGSPLSDQPNLGDRVILGRLDSIAENLDHYIARYDVETRENIGSLLGLVVQSITSDETLDESLRKHLYILVAEVRRCLEEYELTGDFALKAAVDRLSSAVAEAKKTTKKPSKWAYFADRFFWPTASALTATYIQLAIMPSAGSGVDPGVGS